MMFVRHRRSECIAVFEFSRPRHLSETSMSPLLLVLSIIASQTPPVPSGTIAPIDQTQCAFITALAQWESQCRDGVARAFLVDSDSTVQALNDHLAPKEGDANSGRLVCASSRDLRWTALAWDPATRGEFDPSFTRVMTIPAVIDYAWEVDLVTISNSPQPRMFSSLGEMLGASQTSTLGDRSLADLFAQSAWSEGTDAQGQWVSATWGAGASATSLRVRTPVGVWRPSCVRYEFAEWWVNIEAAWDASGIVPTKWVRTAGDEGEAEQSAMSFSTIECTVPMGAAVDFGALSERYAQTHRIVDSRADVTIDFDSKMAWVFGVEGQVKARPSSPLQMIYELPSIVEGGIPPGAPTVSRPGPKRADPARSNEESALIDFACDVGSGAHISLSRLASSMLPQVRQFSVRINNPSPAAVRFSKITSTCGCLSPKLEVMEIQAGASTMLSASLALVHAKDKAERIDLVSDSGLTSITVYQSIDVDTACRLATPIVVLGDAVPASAVFLARTTQPSPPPLPALASDDLIQVSDASPWAKLFSAPDEQTTVWWTEVSMRRVKPTRRTVVLSASGPGMGGACQVVAE